jgi:hypothetical protein
MGRRERHTEFWFEKLTERGHPKPRPRQDDNIKMYLKNMTWAQIGLICFRKGH